jgi:hypothetical protein
MQTEYFPRKVKTKETYVRSVYSNYDDKKKLDFDWERHTNETQQSVVNKFLSSNQSKNC